MELGSDPSLAYLCVSFSFYLSVSPSQIFSAEKIPPFVCGEGGGKEEEEESRGEGERGGEGKRTVSLIVCLEYEWEIQRCVYVISGKSVL